MEEEFPKWGKFDFWANLLDFRHRAVNQKRVGNGLGALRTDVVVPETAMQCSNQGMIIGERRGIAEAMGKLGQTSAKLTSNWSPSR